MVLWMGLGQGTSHNKEGSMTKPKAQRPPKGPDFLWKAFEYTPVSEICLFGLFMVPGMSTTLFHYQPSDSCWGCARTLLRPSFFEQKHHQPVCSCRNHTKEGSSHFDENLFCYIYPKCSAVWSLSCARTLLRPSFFEQKHRLFGSGVVLGMRTTAFHWHFGHWHVCTVARVQRTGTQKRDPVTHEKGLP